MTIRPGENWGSPVARDADLRIAADDADAARLLTDGTGLPVALGGGDLSRTLGSRPIADRTELRRHPVDLLDVTLDDGRTLTALAHVLVRRPWTRGGWWRGEVVAVMNAEFVGGYDVAPRGHPNDGRAEVLRLDAATRPRVRRAIARRMRSGSHLPHPAITTRSVRSIEVAPPGGGVVLVDGVAVGRSASVVVTVRADAAEIDA